MNYLPVVRPDAFLIKLFVHLACRIDYAFRLIANINLLKRHVLLPFPVLIFYECHVFLS